MNLEVPVESVGTVAGAQSWRQRVLDCMMHPQQQQIVFKLLTDDCSDFTDTNCFVIS